MVTQSQSKPDPTTNESHDLPDMPSSVPLKEEITDVKQGKSDILPSLDITSGFERLSVGNDTSHSPELLKPGTAVISCSSTTASNLVVPLYTDSWPAVRQEPPAPGAASVQPVNKPPLQDSAPMLANSKCSGYFLEPVRTLFPSLLLDKLICTSQMGWMEPFLEQGQLAGKIVCPNRKCGVKLGNYDWAGVRCGCSEWITPVSVVTVTRFYCSTG